MAEKSEDLMVAIVRFFNSALLHFNSQFFGKLKIASCPVSNGKAGFIRVLGDGAKQYDQEAMALDLAIKEYDQALFDLTASIVASSTRM